MRKIVLMLMFAIVGAAACSDSTAPAPARAARRIYNIKVPPTAAPADSITISFNYDPGACDSALVVEARPSGGQIRFAVSSIPTNQICAFSLPVAQIISPFVYVVAPPHSLPYTVKFAEPGEADSVRVVQAP
jgi:hypothetical protein